MENFTPGSALAGGIVIGLSAVLLMALLGRIAGISGIVRGIIGAAAGETAWRMAFLVGLVAGPVLWGAVGGAVPPVELAAALPKNAQIVYLPASWNAPENWPMFQRMYLTALSLGVADKTHEAMYDAIWTTGELGIIDKNTRRLKTRLPTIEDAAKFYERTAGVKPHDFVNASKSFGVDLKIKQAEAQIKAMQIASTPTLVVAGKYRINNDAFRTVDEIVDLVSFLVAKESGAAAAKPAGPAPKPATAPAKP